MAVEKRSVVSHGYALMKHASDCGRSMQKKCSVCRSPPITPTASPKSTCACPAAVALQKYKTANGGVDLHGKHPQPPPKRVSLTNGRILLRPRQHHAAASLAWFVTTVHKHSSRWDRLADRAACSQTPGQDANPQRKEMQCEAT